MSRLSTLVSRPRRTLAALATVLVAVGITAASGADFTATSANADTTFATGTLTIPTPRRRRPSGRSPPTCAPAIRPASAPSTS